MFELRAVIEPMVGRDTPERLVVYLPGCQRDDVGSVLMEAEKAGDVWEPRLKTIARNVLRRKFTDGVIDEPVAIGRCDLRGHRRGGGGFRLVWRTLHAEGDLQGGFRR